MDAVFLKSRVSQCRQYRHGRHKYTHIPQRWQQVAGKTVSNSDSRQGGFDRGINVVGVSKSGVSRKPGVSRKQGGPENTGNPGRASRKHCGGCLGNTPRLEVFETPSGKTQATRKWQSMRSGSGPQCATKCFCFHSRLHCHDVKTTGHRDVLQPAQA